MIQEIKIWSDATILGLESKMNSYLALNRDASFQLMQTFQNNAGEYVCICFVLKP
jgi:hypothetical protein